MIQFLHLQGIPMSCIQNFINIPYSHSHSSYQMVLILLGKKKTRNFQLVHISLPFFFIKLENPKEEEEKNASSQTYLIGVCIRGWVRCQWVAVCVLRTLVDGFLQVPVMKEVGSLNLTYMLTVLFLFFMTRWHMWFTNTC